MMVSGNTVLIQLCMFESETDSEEVEEWIIQARLQVDVSEWWCVLYKVGHITVIDMISLAGLRNQTANSVLLMLHKPCSRSPSQSQTASF